MSAQATRRDLFGAMLLPPSPMHRGAQAKEGMDGELLRLTAELEAIQARADGPKTQSDDNALDDVLAEYWAVADQIEATPAHTPEGIRAKARVLSSIIEMVGQDDGPRSEHTKSLLRDMLA